MILEELPAKFAKLELEIGASRGEFALFALFQRSVLRDLWDLLISAPWASANKKAALEYMVEKIKADLGPDYLTQLSNIVFIDPSNEALEKFQKAVFVEHGAVEIRDTNIFGQDIRLAVIITCKQLCPVAA